MLWTGISIGGHIGICFIRTGSLTAHRVCVGILKPITCRYATSIGPNLCLFTLCKYGRTVVSKRIY